MKSLAWIAAGLMLTVQAGGAHAEALRPSDDQTVLATVAARPAGAADIPANPAPNPQDLEGAIAAARKAIEMGRANADPRSYGEAEATLSPWWNLAEPPAEVRILRAVIRQANHEFTSATADLDAILNAAPRNAQALLSRAFLRLVTGDIAGAASDCRALPPAAGALIRGICTARAAALSGQADKGRALLERVLARDSRSGDAMRLFGAAVLADINIGLGRNSGAGALFEAAIKMPKPDVSLLSAYADFLLDAGQPEKALALLDGKGQADALLLRQAIAAKRVNDPRLPSWMTILNERFAAAAAAGIRVHLREEARFRLEVEDNAAAALPLAIANWKIQKEPADARLLLQSAIAAGDKAAANDVVAYAARTGLHDARLAPLLAQTQDRP